MSVLADALVLGLAAGADQWSTHVAIQRGGVEGNALMRQPAVAMVVKAGMVAGVTYGCEQLRKSGHKNLPKVVVGVVAGAWVAGAVHNWRFRP